MGMHPINFPYFMGFKQKSIMGYFQDASLYKVRGLLYTESGGGNLHFTPAQCI